LDFMEKRLGDPAALEEPLADSEIAGRRILRLIAHLLDVSRLEDNRFDVCPIQVKLAVLLEGLIAQRKLIARSMGVCFHLTASAEVCASADLDLLSRVIENLFDNALRYAPRNGRIDVTVSAIGERV